MLPQFFSSWDAFSTQFLVSLGGFLPKLLGASLVFVFGLLLAKLLRSTLRKVLQAINFSKLVGQTPLQVALENPEIGRRFETGLVSSVYWLSLLLVIHTAATILGLGSVTLLIEKILNYLPQIFSAILVLGFGVVLAGAVEGLVKGAVRGMGLKQAIWLGKISSYLVICIAILSSLSELGIARDFITILFVGFIGSISLAVGLALGLGSKETIGKIFDKWYRRNFLTDSETEFTSKPKSDSKIKK